MARMRKPRFTPVPHEAIDSHMRELSGPEFKVLVAILRKSHGWDRDRETISLSAISEMTGHSKGTCSEAVRVLQERKLILIVENKTDEGGSAASTYEPIFEDDPVRPSERGVLPSERGSFAPANPKIIRDSAFHA